MQIWTSLEETGLWSALPYALVLLVAALPLPPRTCGAPVLEADAEVDRRGFRADPPPAGLSAGPPAGLSVAVAGAPCHGPDGRLLPGSAWVGA